MTATALPTFDGSFRLPAGTCPPVPDASLTVVSPVDGSALGTVHEFSPEEIDAVLEECAAEQPAWAARPVNGRAAVLNAFADRLVEAVDELAELLMMEIAKARKDARDEVNRSADFVRFVAEEVKHLSGESQLSDAFPGQGRNKLAVTQRVPLGTVLAIPPFNYPVNLAVSKVAPALATGNAVVLKPPSQGALSGIAMMTLAHAAGVPAGVAQVVTGRGSRIGDYLVQHPRVNMISFTGSTQTGRDLASKAGMVPLMLELGGKDAAIVLPDADVDATAADIVAGAFAYSGQRCTAVKRVLAIGDVADRLVEAIAVRVRGLSVGDPRDDSTVTPLVDENAAKVAEELVADAVAKGATVVVGGGRSANLMSPTLLDHVDETMDIAWVEPFAPVLPVIRVANAAEAIRISNASEYGLQAAVFTRDIDAAFRVAGRLDVGTVQVNGRTARGPDHFAFVGTKSSGLGAQGVRPSLEAMTRLKSTVLNLGPVDLASLGAFSPA